MNNAGQIVGRFNTTEDASGIHGFLLSNGDFSTVDASIPGAHQTTPQDINSAGHIVGNYFDSISNTGHHGYLDIAGSSTTLDVPEASSFTEANGINDAGHIVGTFQDVATSGFLYVNGTFSNIDVPGAYRTFAQDINNAEHVVGFIHDVASVEHSFLKVGTSFTSLDVPVPGVVNRVCQSLK
jgi:probable HAF family extracellular repeat protein